MTLPDLVSPVYAAARKNIQRSPCHVNRASALGGDCERQLVYMRTHWQERELHDEHLELIFQEGRRQERAVLHDLADAGVEIHGQQDELEWRVFQITGHVDGVVVVDGAPIPFEIKSMSDHIWNSVAKRGPGVYAWEEVESSFQRKPWLRKYLGQLSIYMLCKNVDHAILYLKNKSTGGLAQVNVELDWDYAESLIRRAERINGHVAAGTLPERIPFDDEVCPRCGWYSLCLPDCVGKNAICLLDDEVIVGLLQEWAYHQEARDAWELAAKRVKAWGKAKAAELGESAAVVRLVLPGWMVEVRTGANGSRRVTPVATDTAGGPVR